MLAGCNPLQKKQKAGLQIETNNITSTVFINDTYLEKTPLKQLGLQPGTYQLTIQPDDPKYVAHQTTITLRGGTLTAVAWKPGTRAELSGGVIYELEPIKDKKSAEVSIVTIPDEAIVSLDGGQKEFAPMIFTNLNPGKHTLMLVLPSYQSQELNIDALAGYRTLVTAKLAKEDPSAASGESLTTGNNQNSATESAEASPETETATSSARTRALTGTQSQEIPLPRITIKSTNFFQAGEEVLRVRDQAGAQGKELGFAPVGNSYAYFGQTLSGWHKISFNGQEGWVSSQFTILEE